MTKDNLYVADLNWYELWVQQSNVFLQTADKYLNPLFNNRGIHPNLHAEQIQRWLEAFKMQWHTLQDNFDKETYKEYWEAFNQLYQEAIELLLCEWKKLADANSPINTVQELYTLWINCCNEVHQKALSSKQFQTTYADFMNTAMRSWKSPLPK